MRLLNFDPSSTFFIDIIAWVIIHLSIGFSSSRIPLSWLNPNLHFFQTFNWEKDGKIYDQVFHVRAWKQLVPDGSVLYPGAFSIKHLQSTQHNYLQRWLKESIRSELCHWAMIIPGFLFFLWNSFEVGLIMVAYALLNNLFPIVLQRFNRPRMRKMIEEVKMKEQTRLETALPQQI